MHKLICIVVLDRKLLSFIDDSFHGQRERTGRAVAKWKVILGTIVICDAFSLNRSKRQQESKGENCCKVCLALTNKVKFNLNFHVNS